MDFLSFVLRDSGAYLAGVVVPEEQLLGVFFKPDPSFPNDCLERLVSEMIYYVLSGTLNSTQYSLFFKPFLAR